MLDLKELYYATRRDIVCLARIKKGADYGNDE
jgi:hypothetical protein